VRPIFLLLLVTAACGSEPGFSYPKDDELRLEHIQVRGTHNSYHIAPENPPVEEWAYTHEPLGAQLAAGVRQFELDVHIDVFLESIEVYHLYRLDEGTTCRAFVDCLRALKRWSDANPAHEPISIMVEVKDPFDEEFAPTFYSILEEELLSVWPEERLVTPALVQGDAATLREAITTRGWPTLGELRGRLLLFLLVDDDNERVYTGGNTSLAGRHMFVATTESVPWAAVVQIDDPITYAARIQAAVADHFLVRTRVDVSAMPVLEPARLTAATAAGAHFLSSDDPSFTMQPACNPVTAPAECAATDIEDPAFIDQR
jgi:hypothetical protein